MKNVSVVHTNVILRFLLADHEGQFRRAERFFGGVQEGSVSAYIPDSVIAECVYVLQKVYGVPNTEIAENLNALLSYRGVTGGHVQPMREALSLIAKRNISIGDALVFAFARHNDWKIETFDAGLRKLTRD
jgi:predicted nucleic acid-binding protein